MKWLNFNFITRPNLFIHAICWAREVWSKKFRTSMWFIWHAVVWVIWNARNNRIFNGKTIEMEELVEQIKVTSWHWSMSRLKIATCLYYEWCWNPRVCIGG